MSYRPIRYSFDDDFRWTNNTRWWGRVGLFEPPVAEGRGSWRGRETQRQQWALSTEFSNNMYVRLLRLVPFVLGMPQWVERLGISWRYWWASTKNARYISSWFLRAATYCIHVSSLRKPGSQISEDLTSQGYPIFHLGERLFTGENADEIPYASSIRWMMIPPNVNVFKVREILGVLFIVKQFVMTSCCLWFCQSLP